MKKTAMIFVLIILSLRVLAQEDAENCKDHPMFNRMPNTFIGQCSQNYDQVDVQMSREQLDTKECTRIFVEYLYNHYSGVPALSFFQIVKNYENAVIKKGGKKFSMIKMQV